MKITKPVLSKHKESLIPFVKDFVDTATTISLPLLPQHLATFPSRWPFPRGDLYHWIPLLNRFDTILEDFTRIYALRDGPQTREFTCEYLELSQTGENAGQVADQKFAADGDRHLMEAVLDFSRLLLENCGNRSIYASSAYLNDLLNTTSLTLLISTLQLGSQLAQRYQASLKRMGSTSRSLSSALLLNHYNINLERVQQLAQPFIKISLRTEQQAPTTPITPGTTGKNKDRGYFSLPAASSSRTSVVTSYGTDLAAIATSADEAQSWDDWGHVRFTYHSKISEIEKDLSTTASTVTAPPASPTPVRRTSNLGNPQTPRGKTADDPSTQQTRSHEDPSSLRVIDLESSRVKSTSIHEILREYASLPQEVQYDLLNRLRVAKALTHSLETRRQILAIRALAITNLAYVHPEQVLQEKVLRQDGDEPRRLQLVYQLTELVHPPAEGRESLPRWLQSVSLATLAALSQHASKQADVSNALNTQLSHGVILYLVRRAVAEMATDSSGDRKNIDDEWRDSLYSLLNSLLASPRSIQDLATAGIQPILVEALNLRTSVAERFAQRTLSLFDSIIYNARDAFQSFVDAGGLDALSNLMVYEVTTSYELVNSGNSNRIDYRSSAMDYAIPHHKYVTLKWLVKFIHTMMTSAGSYGGNFDRLLRNLIDSPKLLAAIRTIISDGRCFGSSVWANAVSIVNEFINNEPTSFAIIAEAGLSKAILEAVTGQEINVPAPPEDTQASSEEDKAAPEVRNDNENDDDNEDEDDDDEDDDDESMDSSTDDSVNDWKNLDDLEIPKGNLAGGILPAREAISVIPNAFSAICLNTSGMKMFQSANALQSFFQIFISEDHVKCLDRNEGLAGSLGSAFDELVRHHPALKQAVLKCTIETVVLAGKLCRTMGQEGTAGASLWNEAVSKGKGKASSDGDVEMSDVSETISSEVFTAKRATDEAAGPYISSIVSFLHSLFLNNAMRNNFIEKSGLEYVLDFTELPCLPLTFAGSSLSQTLNTVITFLAEPRPVLVFPSLLQRALKTIETLSPLLENGLDKSYFTDFVVHNAAPAPDRITRGTQIVKSLISLQSLLLALQQCVTLGYPRGQSTGLTTLNLNDYYVKLIRRLGPLLTSTDMEGILLRHLVPQSWASETELGEFKLSEEMNEIFGANDNSTAADSNDAPMTGEKQASAPKKTEDKRTLQYYNYKVLRYVLDVTASTIPIFFQAVGKVMAPKRYAEKHTPIAEAMAEVVYAQLTLLSPEQAPDQLEFIGHALDTAKNVLADNLRQEERQTGCTTLMLQRFRELGGMTILSNLLEVTSRLIAQGEKSAENSDSRSRLPEQCTKKILDIYLILVNSKSYAESSLRERDRRLTSSPQLLVEMRTTILRAVRGLWESELVEKAPSDIVEQLVEIIRLIAGADGEAGAHKLNDRIPVPSKPSKRPWKVNEESLERLKEEGYDSDLALEALYRCNNSLSVASDYCRAHTSTKTYGRNNIPSEDLPLVGNGTPDANAMALDDSTAGTSASGLGPDSSAPQLPPTVEQGSPADDLSQLLQEIVPGLRAVGSPTPLLIPDRFQTPPQRPGAPPPETTTAAQAQLIVIEHLDEERSHLRKNLIDRCLDVINSHNDVTFQIADLIRTAISKSTHQGATKAEIGETLVNALLSFAAEDDVRPIGNKLAAYAHLLALLLQDQGFYEASINEVKSSLPTLISFIRLPADHNAETPCPWIPNILLVVETLLTEDEQPAEYDWKAPTSVKDTIEQYVKKTRESSVSKEDRDALFEAILDVLPRVGKNDTLALSVLRILVMLTRSRQTAETMGDRKNLQRLFVMAKQLGGSISQRLRSPIMLILRHIIEDKDTIEQIMRTEILTFFESPRTQRHIDVQAYLRQMSHLVIREPDIFIKVTEDLVKLTKWTLDVPGPEPAGRQLLALKHEALEKKSDNPVLPPIQDTGDLSLSDIKPSTETVTETPEKPKSTIDHKTPIVEHPDGVIHFLLRELLNYRDVEDKEPAPTPTDSVEPNEEDKPSSGQDPAKPEESKEVKKSSKHEFKAEDHPIHVYRCFLLQCLTELLSCYNRTKLEFLNFKKNSPLQAMTPSKPRSSVINYLLYDLVPVGTLEHAETVAMKKRATISGWADSVITALVSRTSEHLMDQSRDALETEEEPDLLFVRKFVLEYILKAYNQATASVEPLDVRYSRMLSLAELMTHIMTGKDNHNNLIDHNISTRSNRQIRRLMFEKGFIASLTNSIADIDLNIPGARRAVKYILRPLKALTQIAIEMSDLNLPMGGQADEDEIMSASSLSDVDDEREETPDLFRGSALGMFDSGRDQESSDDDEDGEGEEMYEQDYDEGMDYDDEMMVDDDDEENVSDEDEEIEGIGPIEGLPGDAVDVEVIMDEDEDEDSDEDGSDDDDDSDDMDEDDDHDHMIDIIDDDGPIHGEDEGEDDEWSDEDEDEEDYEEQGLDIEEADVHGMGHGPLGHLVRALGGDDHEGAVEILEQFDGDELGEDDPINLDNYVEEGQDDEDTDDDDEDELEDEEMLYDEFAVPDYRIPYRAHRSGGLRDHDDGSNPLLQRTGSAGRDSGRASGWSSIGNPASFFDFGSFGRGPFAEGPGAILSDLLSSLPIHGGGPIGRHGHAFHLHVTGPTRDIAREFQAMFGMREPHRPEARRDGGESGTFDFVPASTTSRWADEAKMLFGNAVNEKAHRIANAIVAVLVPVAFEEYKQIKAIQEIKQKEEEEARRKREEEHAAQRAKEAEEEAARERQRAEEREAARLAAEAAAGEQGTEISQPQHMEGVEHTTPRNPNAPRATTIIRGEEIDITNLGIDPVFLEEIPEEFREDVIMSTIAERRMQPEEIDQDFLSVLPESFREDLLAQERRERRQRDRDEQRRQANAAAGVSAPQADMDAASILASFPPDLRNQVLLEQDEDILAQLPQELAEQARALAREYDISESRLPQVVNVGGRRPPSGTRQQEEEPAARPPRRAVIQILDKSGVATLLRLMFVLQQGSLRNTLFNVLQNISENRQNRAEVISTLLHILQDGSADMSAVERSFAHLSLRARQPKDKEPRTPVPLKRSLTGTDLSTVTINSDISPLTVVQQCLNALGYLCQVNHHVAPFFLTEHDSSFGMKRSFSRKGKGKDSKAAKYALNSLLSLLDRPLIMESSTVMELLSYLLNRITQPLQTFERKQKEAEAKKQEGESTQGEQGSDSHEGQPAGDAAEASVDTEPQEHKEDIKDKEAEKKPRPLSPPVIPDYNLKLVTNIFLARECSSKTFRETISTIKNLSAIPGAKNVFGQELISKAQELAERILVDLNDLLPQIQKATSGTDIQGVALAKFSQTSSDQNKLLRVLTALDHLFDPKNQSKSEDATKTAKQDTLSQLYENATFGPMWEKLCDCLSAIRQREHMLNVATILLPLIESLMVVCKNTTLKDYSLRAQAQREVRISSPGPAESRMESLFFTFTEDHRKILNDLVRHNPKLMSGTFSLLVKNPKVLDFDNKRNYFTRNIHSRNQQNRQTFPPLQLALRRDRVFHDSFKALHFKSADEIKYGKLSIRFHGEEGVDAGGVTREWFQVLARQMFDPGYVLFTPVSSDRTTFHPNRSSAINDEHLWFFKFIGRIIGKALYEGRVLDCHFSRAVYKSILGKSVSLKDMESLDLDYYKSLVWMLENDITDIITETFSVDNDVFGVVETIDLVPDGRNIPVTQENKHEYVRLVTEWKLVGSVKEQLNHFLEGFHDIIPAELIAIFNEQELELLISGLPEIDVDDWKNHTEYHNYNSAAPQIQWFWRAVRSFDKEERAKLLQFVTGTSKVPLNGFKELEGMNGVSRFNIHRDYGDKDRLPSSHTCFNQLDLPEYTSYENLRHQLLVAITQGSEYFGFA